MNGLFSPVTIGPASLKHRVVMAPLTRSRSVQPGGVPGDLMVEYYSQRASDGGLIITEASSILQDGSNKRTDIYGGSIENRVLRSDNVSTTYRAGWSRCGSSTARSKRA